MTVADFTETELIDRIRRQLPPSPDWMLVGIGDDAAVIEPARNRAEVLTVDALVEGVHFDRAFVPPGAIGHRALAVNLSDLAAMGAEPRLALLSMAVPPSMLVDDFDQIVGGFASLARSHRLHLAGGNLTRSPGPLMLDVTAIGSVKRRQALTRAGARPGDALYVTGWVGAAAAGLQMLQADPGATRSSDRQLCVDRYLRPEPRVRAGVLVARNRAARACIDLSDGLSDALHQIGAASGVGARIDADALPVAPGARDWFEAQGFDAVSQAATGGDDYELLVAVGRQNIRKFQAVAARGSVPFTRIGTCTEDRAILIHRDTASVSADRPLPRKGYSHFR
jgi:thiamine-monophosphate kinase